MKWLGNIDEKVHDNDNNDKSTLQNVGSSIFMQRKSLSMKKMESTKKNPYKRFKNRWRVVMYYYSKNGSSPKNFLRFSIFSRFLRFFLNIGFHIWMISTVDLISHTLENLDFFHDALNRTDFWFQLSIKLTNFRIKTCFI